MSGKEKRIRVEVKDNQLYCMIKVIMSCKVEFTLPAGDICFVWTNRDTILKLRKINRY